MDPKTRDRILKPAAHYYHDVIRSSEREQKVVAEPMTIKTL
jgi:hypothetical protein